MTVWLFSICIIQLESRTLLDFSFFISKQLIYDTKQTKQGWETQELVVYLFRKSSIIMMTRYSATDREDFHAHVFRVSLRRRDLSGPATLRRHLLYSSSSCPHILRLCRCAPPSLCEWDWPSSFSAPHQGGLMVGSWRFAGLKVSCNKRHGSPKKLSLKFPEKEKKMTLEDVSLEMFTDFPCCQTPVASVFQRFQ